MYECDCCMKFWKSFLIEEFGAAFGGVCALFCVSCGVS